jgi:hypothetical protein
MKARGSALNGEDEGASGVLPTETFCGHPSWITIAAKNKIHDFLESTAWE